jgi:hypothetical protein
MKSPFRHLSGDWGGNADTKKAGPDDASWRETPPGSGLDFDFDPSLKTE